MAPHNDSLDARIRFLEAEAAENPTSRTYAPLTEAYRLSGRIAEAVRTGRAGVSAYPDHVAIRVALARSLADADEREEALAAYREVLRHDPGNAEAASFVEAAASSVGDPAPHEPGTTADAADAGDSADAGAPAGAEPRHRTEPGRSTGTLSEELAHLADLFTPAAPSGGGPPETSGIATLTLAEIYSRQGLFGKAAEICELILERDPDNERARRALEEYRRRPASV